MNLEALINMAVQRFGTGNLGAIAELVEGLLRQFTNQTQGGLEAFLELFRSAGLREAVNGWIGGNSTSTLREGQLNAALGGAGILDSLASRAGMSKAAALPLLGFLIPKLVGVLTPGGQMPDRAALLQQMETLSNSPVLKMHALPAAQAEKEKVEGPLGWIVPVVAGLALIIGVLVLSGLLGMPDATKVEAKAETTAAVREPIPGLGAFTKRQLPTGKELDVPENGIESKVVAFIQDTTKPVDKTTWFDFDRLLFDFGKATLQPSSEEQLQNVADILTAFPMVKVKIGGYTDNVGTKEANMKLSDERAKNVMSELVNLGVAADRLSAEGYGDQFPVGDNSTEEGRAKNRRIALRVTEK